MKKNFLNLSALETGFLLFGLFFFIIAQIVFAVDGSGTNSVSPTSVYVNSTGNTEIFTFTATETMDSGGFTIAVPSEWSAPQGTSGVVGYTIASSVSGIIATVLNTLDGITNWSATNHMALSADTGDKQEGTASLLNAITSSATANEQWYFNYGSATSWGTAANGTNGQRVGFWIKSSVNTASGNLSWQSDNTASLASPEDTLSIAALVANTWQYTSVTLGAARTSQLSYGLRYTSDIGAADIRLDSISVLFDAADVTTNWTGDSNISVSALGSGQEGTNSIRCTYATAAGTGTSGECYRSSGALTILPGNKVSFWVRPSVAISAGDFAWVDDNSANLSSPSDVVSIPAISANTWTYVTLSIPGMGTNNIRSYGLRQVVDKGAMTIDIDAMGTIIDYCDSTTGWTAPTSVVQTLSSDSSVYHEGTASVKNVITAFAGSGDSWYQSFGSNQDWSSYTTVGFWVRSTVNTSAGDLKFQYSSSTDLSSPIASLNIGALTANTWSYQKLTLSGTRTSIRSYGINYSTDIGAVTINLDDVLIGPGALTFPGGGIIGARILSLASPQTIIVTYGSGGGASGATAPSSTGNYTFTTQSRISDSGTLTNISSSPVVAVLPTPDTTAPAAVSNLSVTGTGQTTANLSWTAPGDDNNTGTATTYDVRYSTATITEGNWSSATSATGEPSPSIAGSSESMTVTGLSPSTTYYFAIKTSDEVPNTSAISNVASGTTTATPIVVVSENINEPESGGVPPTNVFFSGKAYPKSFVELLRKGSLDENFFHVPVENYSISNIGIFNIGYTALLQGEYVLALRARDKEGLQTGIMSFGANLASENELKVENIIFPPTIGFNKTVITKGNDFLIKGYSSPNSVIEIKIDDIINKEVRADSDGYYNLIVDISPFDFGNHYLKARQITEAGEKSNYSVSRVFKISDLLFPKSDFNNDNIVNITDWSIFLFRWGSRDESLKSKIDMNDDGKINIIDFSIFLKSILN